MRETSGCKAVDGPGDAIFRVASTASADMREAGHQRVVAAAVGYEDEPD